jgi:hypothetical protein
MHGYIDPFDRTGAERADDDLEEVDLGEEEADGQGQEDHLGLDAIADDLSNGRREAPLSSDPSTGARPPGE